MKKLNDTILVATAMTILGAGAAMATDTDDFVKKAAIANMYEIETSKVALNRSTSADVKAFAQQMIDDHTKVGADFKAAATTGGIAGAAIPAALDEKHAKKLAKLNEEDAGDFDDEYLDEQEEAHEEAIKLFKDYADDGDNASLKTFAANTLPSLQQHREKVETLDEKY